MSLHAATNAFGTILKKHLGRRRYRRLLEKERNSDVARNEALTTRPSPPDRPPLEPLESSTSTPSCQKDL